MDEYSGAEEIQAKIRNDDEFNLLSALAQNTPGEC